MQHQKSIWQLLNDLTFTNKEVADYAGVTESMVKKIRVGITNGSREVQERIKMFMRMKVKKVSSEIKTSTLFSVDDV